MFSECFSALKKRRDMSSEGCSAYPVGFKMTIWRFFLNLNLLGQVFGCLTCLKFQKSALNRHYNLYRVATPDQITHKNS
jgi:hypothetical protein